MHLRLFTLIPCGDCGSNGLVLLRGRKEVRLLASLEVVDGGGDLDLRFGCASDRRVRSSPYFPGVQVLATGSSTLGASNRFRDTLAGRKTELWRTPMITADLEDFGNLDLPHRLLRGGLPPFFLSADLPERDFQEWLDAYWAKDILELFRLERRTTVGGERQAFSFRKAPTKPGAA